MNAHFHRYTADITRLACADAGDTANEDANFEQQAADAQLVKMHAELDWTTQTLQALPTLRAGTCKWASDGLVGWLVGGWVLVCVGAGVGGSVNGWLGGWVGGGSCRNSDDCDGVVVPATAVMGV
jgi:hypothetical protein